MDHPDSVSRQPIPEVWWTNLHLNQEIRTSHNLSQKYSVFIWLLKNLIAKNKFRIYSSITMDAHSWRQNQIKIALVKAIESIKISIRHRELLAYNN